jgi:hypothetical protein
MLTFAANARDVAPPAFNPQGFAGSGYSDTEMLATTGGLSRRELHTIFMASGPSFRSQVRDLTPTGAIDLAPTLIHILGLPDLKGASGRVLTEMLNGGSDPGSPVQATQTMSTLLPDGTKFYELLQIERVGDTSYLNGGGATIGHADETDTALQQRIIDQIGP